MIKCILHLRRKRELRTFQIIKLRMFLTTIKPTEFKIELLHQLKGVHAAQQRNYFWRGSDYECELQECPPTSLWHPYNTS